MTRRIFHAILDLAVEDSYALSEVVARIRQRHNELSEREAKQVARSAVGEMVDAGWIAITRLDNPGGIEVQLGTEEAKNALADDLNWVATPHWRSHVRVVATSAGEQVYRQE